MKFLAMEWRGWELPVTVLGDVSAETPGAAIRSAVRRWPRLRADNFFLKEKDWTSYCTPERVKPLATPPADNPYG